MDNKRLLIAYYKRKLYKGRTVLARAVDFIALRLIMLCAAYLWFSTGLENTGMAAALAFTATLTASVACELFKSIRLERFTIRERKAIAEKLFREKLVQLGSDEFYALVRSYVMERRDSFDPESLVYAIQSATAISEDDVLRVYRNARARKAAKATLFSASRVSDEAKALCARLEGVELRFVTPEEFIKHGMARSMFPNDEAVDEAVVEMVMRERENKKKSVTRPFEAFRTGRYIFAAAGLFALSFFVKQPLYYRLLAGACVSLGAITWWLNGANRQRA